MNLPNCTDRLLGSKYMNNFESRDAILFANQCIKSGIITDSLITLSSLDEKQNSHEAYQYFWDAAAELRLNELVGENAKIGFIKSYALDIINNENEIISITKLYQYYIDSGDKNARIFYLLFWSHRSYELNDEDKDCYYPNYNHLKANEHFIHEAKKYLILIGSL